MSRDILGEGQTQHVCRVHTPAPYNASRRHTAVDKKSLKNACTLVESSPVPPSPKKPYNAKSFHNTTQHQPVSASTPIISGDSIQGFSFLMPPNKTALPASSVAMAAGPAVLPTHLMASLWRVVPTGVTSNPQQNILIMVPCAKCCSHQDCTKLLMCWLTMLQRKTLIVAGKCGTTSSSTWDRSC